MSIETEIASLTTAIRNLTDVLLASAAKALPALTATSAVVPSATVVLPYTEEVQKAAAGVAELFADAKKAGAIPAPAPEPKKAVKKEAAPTELELFQKRLSAHDWTYAMSDDPRVNRAGESAEAALKSEAARGGKEFLAAYEAAHAKAWGQPTSKPAPAAPVAPVAAPAPVPEAPTVSEDDLRVQIVELARPNMGDAAFKAFLGGKLAELQGAPCSISGTGKLPKIDAAHLPTLLAAINKQLGK